MLSEFIKCPVCCGHEAFERETMEELLQAINCLADQLAPEKIGGGLENIRNVIMNTLEREAAIDPLML